MTDARCATAARHRGDPLVGSAAPATRWLLVEHPGGWAPAALRSAGMPPALAGRLDRAAHETGGRVLLVRRPRRRGTPATSAGARRWVVVDAEGEAWGRWRVPEDLDTALATFLGEHRGGEAATDARRSAEHPLLLVCTHGRHDVCCAVRGRPVAHALADRWPDQTWECTHIGGDRFAANLLVVPDGTVYGNLDAVTAPQVVARHLSGVVDLAHLRGFSGSPPVVQVAFAEVLRRHGPAPPTDVRSGTVDRRGEDEWVVEVWGSGPLPQRTVVRVARGQQDPALLTCHATHETSAHAWSATVDDDPTGDRASGG